MSTLVILSAILAFANAGITPIVPLSSTTILEGPSSSASINGPDGSSIISATPGGRIAAVENSGLTAIGYSALTAPIAPLASIAQINAPVVAKTFVPSPLTASGYSLLAPGSGLEG
ncbi:hypothetical protein Trydic_g10439 [Trypoxylus dichotomus]